MKVNIGDYDSGVSEVEIEKFDTWNLDHTLALIICPALKQLKENKNGAPFVSNEDVPKELHSPNIEDSYDTDANWFKRFDYILGEMIWAFEQIIDEDSDDQFHSGVHDPYNQALDKDMKEIGEPFPFLGEGPKGEYYQMVKGPKDTSSFDAEGYTRHHKRIVNGTRLFGVYYTGLWD